ncbi:MAG: AraC family transcriptional regulator [Saprospirales bacterium]|nr:AraC family transcriptional regulator [Saprospirales bacterium]
METIAWIGFSQALFAGLIIAAKKRRNVADKLLSAWLILMAIEFATFGIDLMVFGTTPLLSNPFLLFNPALYLYARSLTDKKFTLRWVYLLHLMPYIAFEGTAYILGERRELSLFFEHNATLWFRIFFAIAALVSWVFYPTLSIVQIHRHRLNLKHEFSTIESYKRISWLLFVLIFYMLYWTSSLAVGLYNSFSGKIALMPLYNYPVLLALTYIMGFYGLQQETIFPEEKEEGSEKYKRSRLREDYKQRVKQRLLTYFESDKPYLNPELAIGNIATALKVPRHVLTEVLNTTLGKNFYQFVNEYRVEAVKQMLISPKGRNISIEAIGFDCGFNSKSTFFSVFKSLTETTPAQYQEQHRR